MASQKGDIVSSDRHYFNRCVDIDEKTGKKTFETYSLWNRASDCELDDGTNVQDRLTEIIENVDDLKSTDSIGGWNFNQNAFYRNSTNIGTEGGAYLGKDGISVGNHFVVDNKGVIIQSGSVRNIYKSRLDLEEFLGPDEKDLLYITNNQIVQVKFNQVYIGDKIGLRISYWYRYSKTYHGEYYGMNGMSEDYEIDVEYNNLNNDSYTFKMQLDEDSHILTIDIPGRLINGYGGSIGSHLDGYDGYKYKDNELKSIITLLKPSKNSGYKETEVKEVTIKQSNGIIIKQFDGIIIGQSKLIIDTINNQIVDMDNFKIDKETLCHNGISTSSSGNYVMVDSNGYFHRGSSSSERYKKDITQNICDILNPHNLYDLNIYQFKYNDDYLQSSDQRYGKDIIGFIAEDIYEKYPVACNLNDKGLPEVPEYNMLIAPMLKLIQEQHSDIEKLKEEIKNIQKKSNK